MKSRHFCGASAVVLAAVWGLHATPSRAAEAAAAATDQSGAATVGELVVTAERRSQNIETVPVAVTAFTARERNLIGISSVQDLTDFTPGLSYSTYDNRPYIRGIGRQTDNLAVESGVAVYVDGIYFGANASTILQLDSLFVDRIEVVRGPQSTLYGRNADGGAINYISVRPSNQYRAEVRTGVDNYDKQWLEGLVSGPITDTLKFLISGNVTRQSGGYYTNLDGPPEGGSVAQGGNGDSYHYEGQLQWNPNDKFEWWAKAGASNYWVSFHTQTLVGPQDMREFYDPLMPNQNYGLCTFAANAGAADCAPGANPDTIVPGSVVTLPNTIAGNPSAIKLRNFDADFTSDSREEQNLIAATTLTWHASSFDVKYLFGYQKFYYYLTAPWLFSEGVSSGVEQYALQGPATATATCLATYDNPGCTQNLVVNPALTQFNFIENEYFYSNELNITSTGNGPVQWIAGLYWYHEHYDQPINVLDPSQAQVQSPVLFSPFLSPAAPNPTGSVYNEYTNLTENSYAGFGQVDWKVTPTIKLTGGIRYTDDNKSGYETFRVILFNFEGAGLGVNTFGANTPAFDATACPTAPPPPYPGAGPCTVNPATGLAVRPLDASWNAVTGTAGVSWTPNPDTLVYAKYSRGYKTGGFNSGIVAPDPETLPEFVNAYEAGYKGTFGGAFQLNATAFYYDYYNDQQPLSAVIDNVVTTIIFNLPVVHSYGIELESYWRPVKNLTLSLNYAYLHATIASMNGACLEDTNDPLAIEPGANPCPASAQVTPGVVLQNIVGQTVPQSPQNKVSLNALYTINFQPGNLTFSGTFIWKDSEYDSVFNRFYNQSPAYTQVNLRATWTSADNRYSVAAFVDNLFNTVGWDGTDGIPVTNPGPGQVVSRLESLTAPQTFGVEFQYRFR